MKLKAAFRIVTISVLLLFPFLLMAQAPGFDQDTNDVPIDGGLSILLAAGIGYGIKRKYKHDRSAKKMPAAKD